MQRRGRWLAAKLGLALALLLLEGSLRLVGYLHTRDAAARRRPVGDGPRTVLCLGDSFTEGLGAERHESFPARLGALLDRGARVINAGRAGLNSAELLARLPSLLDRHRPDLVLLMSGAGNDWNLWGHGLSFDHGQRRSALRDLLFRVRVVRLAALLLPHAREAPPSPVRDLEAFGERLLGSRAACTRYSAVFYPLPVPGRLAGPAFLARQRALLEQVNARLASSPGRGHLYCARALIQARMGAPSAAVATLKRGLVAAPKRADLCYLLGALHGGVIADMKRGGPGWDGPGRLLHGLTYVDHQRAFAREVAGGAAERSLFDRDVMHPNAAGYEVMARGLARHISEEALLE